MQPDEPKAGAVPQAHGREAMTPEEDRAARRAKAIDLLIAAQEHREVTNPELAAKQARLLALMKDETLTPKDASSVAPPTHLDDPLHLATAIAHAALSARMGMALLNAETPPPPGDETPKVWADDDPNRPETEEDGIRARAQQIGQWRYQAKQQQARAAAAAAGYTPPETPKK